MPLKKQSGNQIVIWIITVVLLLASSSRVSAKILSVTFDNDIFLAEDEGYTNGFFLSWFDLGVAPEPLPKSSLLLSPLRWSLKKENAIVGVNTYTIGQIMTTPKDISRANPDLHDIPYAGYLFYSTSHLLIFSNFADTISFSIGIIGPLSGAEHIQIWFHDVTKSTEPEGWDYQLGDEVVFQYSRSRLWRTWVPEFGRGNIDALFVAEAALGTLSSLVGCNVLLRCGSLLEKSFAAPSLEANRTSNPMSIKGGWYLYAGIGGQLLGNLIFADGNTFQSSRSTDLDHFQIGIMAGLSCSFNKFLLTIAIEDFSAFTKMERGRLRFGTFTIAWIF